MNRSIVLIEDEITVRARLCSIVNASEKYRIIAAFGRCEEALEFLKRNRVWLAILDLGLPGISHAEAVRSIRSLDPKMEILVHTVFDADEHVFTALQYGATGYLIKDAQPDRLLGAIDELAAGGAPMSFAIARKVMAYFKNAQKTGPEVVPSLTLLTARENEVLQLLYEGDTYQSIAEKLAVSRHTVHDHIKHIYQKLEVHSRAELMHKTVKENLLAE